LRKAALVAIFTSVVCLPGLTCSVFGQEAGTRGGVQSIGFSSSYSPDSSHIFIGACGQRRVWTLGAEYTRRLHQSPLFRVDYEGSVMPLFEETDPTVVGTTFTFAGQTFTTSQAPVRVVSMVRGPVGDAVTGLNTNAPLYAIYAREDTYAGAISPLGVRVTALPRWRIQPSFGLDMGFVISARDIPVEQSNQFNFLLAVGPGVQFFVDNHTSWRVEYLYRHMSNAGAGFQNPGVDQGVVRVTLSLHR
jgi:hypothetical protein